MERRFERRVLVDVDDDDDEGEAVKVPSSSRRVEVGFMGICYRERSM